MNSLAFVTSFTGKVLATSKNASTGMGNTPRCAMAGDSKAPVIKIRKTSIERENSFSVSFDPINVSLGAADAVTSNTALAITLQKKPTSLPSTTSSTVTKSAPGEASPVDYYYPVESRNLAPYICLNTDDNSLSVAYELVTAKVANVASTSEKEVPFWKQPKPSKWASTDSSTASSSEPEVLSTAAFEAYFPTSIRNRAPVINLRAPAACKWNEQPYLEVGNELVSFNEKLNKMVVLPEVEEENPQLAAASTIAKYYPDDVISKAPKVVMTDSSIEVYMETASVGEAEANEILAKYK